MRKSGKNDRLYFMNLKFVWIFSVLTLIITIFSGEKFLGISDMSVLSTSLSCAWIELSVHTAFIVWKAKVENCRKFKDVNRVENLESEV